jgi:ABC-type dipeptide/oligopeptide/nickel transport system ATPase subunit
VTPRLAVDRLVKTYEGGRPVLTGVSISLAVGEVLGLVGASGCGKSTLARCVAGIEPFESGEIRLDGLPLPGRRTQTQRRRIQYVWQEPQLALSPYLTAGQSVAETLEGFDLAPAGARAAVAADWLARMGLSVAEMHRRPDGLSGGQCQRVVLARALAAQPDVLLLDEPFSALDTVNTVALIRLLSGILAGSEMSVLFVSHDRQAVQRLAARTVTLFEGQAFDGGDPQPMG